MVNTLHTGDNKDDDDKLLAFNWWQSLSMARLEFTNCLTNFNSAYVVTMVDEKTEADRLY